MNRWWILAAVLMAGSIGWRIGDLRGAAERKAIIENLPETRAYYRTLEAEAVALGREPTGRDLVCRQVFDSARRELNKEYRLEAEIMDELRQHQNAERY